MRRVGSLLISVVILSFGIACARGNEPLEDAPSSNTDDTFPKIPIPKGKSIRIATFNAAMNRKEAGDLERDLKDNNEQIRKIATIVQCVQPDVLLMNEVDYGPENAELMLQRFLQSPQDGAQPDPDRRLLYAFAAEVNTGVASGLDLNNNGRSNDADDAWGYGAFPGQYGMVVFSRFPIEWKAIRTFREFRWSAMPGALRPMVVDKETGQSKPFHTDEVWSQLRLSSKSHWDVPIAVGNRTLHVIASHPTPPVFDGPEDRNGCRNHDEIRLLMDYVSGGDAARYIVDDRGNQGGLTTQNTFVILGDLNADPVDGDGKREAIRTLLEHPRLAKGTSPSSDGATEASRRSGEANAKHRGDPSSDTGDFNDKSPGNLRIDYVLPSANCRIVASGVYWPSEEKSPSGHALVQASDHRLVWVDVEWE